MFGSSLPPVVCWKAHVLLTLLYLFANIDVQHILCCIFALFVFFLCFVYAIFPVSLDCPFSIATLVFVGDVVIQCLLQTLVLYVCFVDRCLSFCPFSFGHCVVCCSSIY
jgi:hypothetical protein